MKKELEKALYDTFPQFFDLKTSPYDGGFWGVECDDGWFDIIYVLCIKIQPLAAKIKDFQVVQIKEKFGGLRFYVSHGNEEIHTLIQEAEELSFKTCEVCGEPGQLRGGGWLKTLCGKHHNERN